MKISAVVQTPVTHNLDASLSFYRNLGFHEMADSDPPMFTDGKVLISLNPERTARTAVRLFGNWESIADQLAELTNVRKELTDKREVFGSTQYLHCHSQSLFPRFK